MNINRNNYEEFLLLYIDGELCDKDKKVVDQFLESNLDIKQEFDYLLNTKLQVEDVSFGDLSSLFKIEGASISTINYQEYFLNSVDNELNAEQQQATETFVLQHPQYQEEFLAIQQTRLPIVTIECPNKNQLYKKENESVVSYMLRFAAAAVFIGFAASLWNMNTEKKSIPITTRVATLDKNVSLPSLTPNNAEINIAAHESFVVADEKNKNQTEKTIVVKKTKKAVTKSLSVAFNNSNNNAENVVVKSLSNNVNNSVAVNNQTNNGDKVSSNTTVAFVNNTTSATNANTTKQIIYKTLDTDDDNKPTLVAQEESKSSKLKGLLQKVVKAVTPKDSDDDGSRKLFAVTL